MNCTYYEVLWYVSESKYESKDFKTRKQALNFYNKHKDDKDKFNWWVTKRAADDAVLEDIVW